MVRAWSGWVKTLVVLAGIVLLGFLLRLTVLRPDPVPVSLYRAARGTVEETVTNSKAGTVKARRRSRISPDIGGRVEYVGARSGDRVHKGQVLLRLYDRDLNASVDLAAHEVATAEVEPRGFTPLNDATCQIVNLAKAGNYDKVAIIIMTDGQENQSREDRTGAIAKGMLAECRAKGWQVIMLGVDFDNAQQADSYGNLASASATMSAGMHVNSMRSTASKRAIYGVTGQSMSYSAEEKAEMAKKTPTEAP